MFLKSAAYPETVKPEKYPLSGLKDLVEGMISKTSPILILYPSKLQYVKYSFGDAYGGGIGVTIEGEAVLVIETGTCNALVSQKYSNFR